MARGADGKLVARIGVMSSDPVRRRVIVHGHVQGVFFRDSLRKRADLDAVSGWACNRPDGALEAVLEGPADGVERMVKFCETGPSWARVERIEVSEEPPVGLNGFSIR